GLGDPARRHRGAGRDPGHPPPLRHAVVARHPVRAGRAPARGGRPSSPGLGQLWPELRALIHGGVAFAPYASVFDEWLGRRLERVEVYPASEGFVAVQTEATGGLT